MLHQVFILFFFVAQVHAVSGVPAEPQNYAGRLDMNGLRFSDYQDFEKNWHFVTVRFRKDTAELRMTYANDLAWQALNRDAADFPDGAVLGKIGIVTHDDMAFPSSAVPSGARRYQFMVRDKEKFKETGGWGYALFDANGLTFPEEPVTTAKACAACHGLVPERGFVFSQIMQMAPFVTSRERVDERLKLKFTDAELSSLPTTIRSVLPSGRRDKIRLLEGELRQHLFQGTLDEVRPALAVEAVRSHHPTLLMNPDGSRYALVFEDVGGKCPNEKMVALKGISNIYFKANEKFEVNFCQPR